MQQEKPVRSADGLVVVSGKGANPADKLILITFIQDVRTRVGQLLDSSFDGDDFAVFVYVLEPEQNSADKPVNIEYFPGERILVTVDDIRNLDSRELAGLLCEAWLTRDALAHGCPVIVENGVLKSPYPAWFSNGIAGLLGKRNRQNDIEKVLARWESAALPEAAKLVGDSSPEAEANPSLAAVLASWILDAPERGARWSDIRNRISAGEEWTPPAISVFLGLGPSASELDPAFDMWLLGRRWHVATIGATPPALILRVRPLLDMRPGTPGFPVTSAPGMKTISPVDAIAFKKAAWMPAAAARKADDISRVGLGRSAVFREMTMAWHAFFRELQDGASDGKLRKLLDDAEKKLAALEKKAAAVAGAQGKSVQ